jgi:hypothetical protein
MKQVGIVFAPGTPNPTRPVTAPPKMDDPSDDMLFDSVMLEGHSYCSTPNILDNQNSPQTSSAIKKSLLIREPVSSHTSSNIKIPGKSIGTPAKKAVKKRVVNLEGNKMHLEVAPEKRDRFVSSYIRRPDFFLCCSFVFPQVLILP